MSGRIFYGWFIVLVSFLCLLFVTGISLLSFPVFVSPIEDEFGWSRALILGGVALAAAAVAVCLPVFGHFINKIGIRRLMPAGIFVIGCNYLLISVMHSVFIWYFALLMIGLGVAASTYIPVASMVTNWFLKKRGLAMSIAMAGSGAGGFIMPNAANWLIEIGGWRFAFRIFGIVVLTLLCPLVILIVRGRPRDLGMKPLGEQDTELVSPDKSAKRHSGGFVPVIKGAIRRRDFWAIGAADFCNAFAVVGLGANLVACALDAGIQPPIAAFAYSCVNGVTLASIIIVGLIAERFNHRAMITMAYAMPAVGIGLLFHLHNAAPLFFFAAIAGIAGAARLALWPLVVHDAFGKQTYATMMGLLILFYTVGIALAPPVTGLLYDTTGGYSAILVTTMTAFFLSGVFIAVGTADLKKKTGDIITIFSKNHLK